LSTFLRRSRDATELTLLGILFFRFDDQRLLRADLIY
jgi:hypothetical protein